MSQNGGNPYQEAIGCLRAVERLLTVIDELRIDGRRIIDEPSTSYAFAFMQVKQILQDVSTYLDNGSFRFPRPNDKTITDQQMAAIFRYEKEQLNAIIDLIERAANVSMEKAQHWSKKGFNSADIILDSLAFILGVKFVREFKKQIENLLPS